VQPTLQALLLADFVYIDQATGKKVIAGVFDSLILSEPPQQEPETEFPQKEGEAKKRVSVRHVQQAGSPYVYISITNVHGEKTFVLRYVNLQTYQALFETSFPLASESPLRTAEIVLPVPKLPAAEGVFALELLCEDELIGSHKVHVRRMPQEGR
jgi:hypothetical protein